MRHYDIVHTVQDLTYLSWDEVSNPTGLAGSSPKAREGDGAHATYYKMAPVVGGVPQCRFLAAELISSRVLAALSVPHIEQRLVHARVSYGGSAFETWVLRSKSMRGVGQQAMPLSLFHAVYAQPGESCWQLCARMGWEDLLGTLVVADYLCACQRRGQDKVSVTLSADGSIELAPFAGGLDCFGTGLKFGLWPMSPLANIDAQCVTGLSSLEYGLDLVSDAAWTHVALHSESLSRSVVAGLEDVDGLGTLASDAWNIVKARWAQLARIRNL